MTNFSGENLNATCGGPQGGSMDSRRTNQVAEVSTKYLVDVATNSVPAGYKQTEVGVIPEDWEEFNLGKLVAALESGVSVNSLDKLEGFSHGYHVLKTSCVSNGVFIPSESKSILPKDIKRAKCLVKKGSIIISRMNTPALVGELGFVPTDIPNLFLPDRLWQMRLSAEGSTNSKWLTYLLSYPAYAKKIKESATGTSGSMKNISKGNFLSLEIPLPSSVEQTAIANALSDVDALISELEKLIAKKQAIKTATMQQLLTGRTRLPQFALRDDGTPKGTKPSEVGEIPEDWEVVELGSVARLYQPETISGSDLKDSGFPVYGANGLIGFFDRFNHCESEVIVTCRGSTCGTVNITVPQSWITGNAMVVDTSERKALGKIYAFFLLGFHDLTICISGSGQPQIVRSPLAAFKIQLPSRDEQTAIATILSDMDAEIQALEQRLGKTRQIKQGMMQELLTGKTRLLQPLNKESQYGCPTAKL